MANRRRRQSLSVLGAAAALTLASLSSVAAAPSPGWSTETVDSVGTVGFYKLTAYSPVTGFPAVGYSDEGKDDVKLATWNGAAWAIQTVDAGKNVAEGISLAFDPAGNPALSYGAGPLKFARWTGSAWSIQTIESSNAGNSVTSLVFKDGQPSIAYGYSVSKGNKVSGQLRMARLVGSTWVIETVDTYATRYMSLAYAPDGNPSIAYSIDTDGNGMIDTLKFAHKTGSTWTIQTVETGVAGYGVFASLAYDPLTGYPTISHGNSSPTNLRFARFDGSQWIVEIVAIGQATHSFLAYDAAGIAAISYDYASGTNGFNQLWIARRTGCSGSCWDTQLIQDFAPSNLACERPSHSARQGRPRSALATTRSTISRSRCRCHEARGKGASQALGRSAYNRSPCLQVMRAWPVHTLGDSSRGVKRLSVR